jgi:hypothetical protein
METDRVGAEWQESKGMIVNMIQSGFLEHEIRAVMPVGGSKISQLHKALQDGIDTLHIRRPLCVPTHALHDNDLNMIKVDAESWEGEDGFPCVCRCPNNIFWIQNSCSQSCIRGTRTRSNSPMTAVVLYCIHAGFNTSTCSFLAFV